MKYVLKYFFLKLPRDGITASPESSRAITVQCNATDLSQIKIEKSRDLYVNIRENAL